MAPQPRDIDNTEETPAAEFGRQNIYVGVVIDVDLALKDSSEPGAGDMAPMPLGSDLGHLLVTASGGVTDQATGDVAFDARPGDTVRFYAASGSNNFEQAVLIQDIRHIGGDDVLERFRNVVYDRMSVAPDSETCVLPARLVPRQFWFWQCRIVRKGTGTYCLILALYDRGDDGQPRFVRLCQWAPQLTVGSIRTHPHQQ